MARRFRPKSEPLDNLRIVLSAIPWKLLLLLPILVVLAIPTYLFGIRLGPRILPSVANIFSAVAASTPAATTVPIPPFPSALPLAGSLAYTIQGGDSCDSVLTFQMHMNDASQIFSDANPETVRALGKAAGLDCHALQPGMTMLLSPQYPLVALGGIIEGIVSSATQQLVPTPLINVTQQAQGPDCSGGCNLTVRVSPQVQIHLTVQTLLTLHEGSWIWAQAMLARQSVARFDNYPYATSAASLDGMSMSACDFQIDNIHDDNSLSCDQLTPNTIDDDGGVWLFGATGPSALDHWGYQLKLPAGTQVLVWLSAQHGTLKFQAGNPVYRYDSGTKRYSKV